MSAQLTLPAAFLKWITGKKSDQQFRDWLEKRYPGRDSDKVFREVLWAWDQTQIKETMKSRNMGYNEARAALEAAGYNFKGYGPDPWPDEVRHVEIEGRSITVRRGRMAEYLIELVYGAWEPSELGLGAHSHITKIGDRWYGKVSTGPLPAGLDALAPGDERSERVQQWFEQEYELSYRAIIQAFPEAAHGRHRLMGEISFYPAQWLVSDEGTIEGNPISLSPDEVEIPGYADRLERCVLKVKGQQSGVNPYAVCRASLRTARGLPRLTDN